MNGLDREQRQQVLKLYMEGKTVSQIAKSLGLLREYVQRFISYVNRTQGGADGLETRSSQAT